MSTTALSVSQSPDPPDALATALRLLSSRLEGATVSLYAEQADGTLAQAGASAAGPDLSALAESLRGPLPMRLDLTGAVEDLATAVGISTRSAVRGALLAASPAETAPTDWEPILRDGATLVGALLDAQRPDPARDHARLLCDVATLPGSFDDRLGGALERLTAMLDLDAAVLARVENGTWVPVAVHDPSETLVPYHPVPLSGTYCAMTVLSDGPIGVADGRTAGADRPASYIGAPLLVGGRCVGTLCAMGTQPHAPFSEDERGLIDALARWAGSAMSGRQAAVRLAEREATLATFFDAVPLGMGTLDLVAGLEPESDDLRIGTLNTQAVGLFGGMGADLAGRLASDLGSPPVEIARWASACRRALATRAPSSFEFVADGPSGPLAFAATVVVLDPDLQRFSFVVEDVTAARRAQERLRQLDRQIAAVVANAPVTLFTATADGTVVSVRGADLLGANALPGASLLTLYGGSPEAIDAVHRVLCGQPAQWTAHLNGRTIETYAVPDTEGIAGLHGVVVDVSDRERSLQSAAELQRVEASASEARHALLSHVTYELRSPLSAVLGYADLLDPTAPPDEIAEVRDVVARAGRRMLSALDELGALALVDAGRVTVAAVPVQPDQMLDQVVEAHRVPAAARRIDVAVEHALPEGPVLLDPALFERILRSLIGGAIAATSEGRIDIRLATDGGFLVLNLRAEPSRTSDGIGVLAGDLVRRMVSVMDGTVEEVYGDMWRWTVRLPYRPVPMVDLSASATADLDVLGEALVMAVPPPTG